MATRRARVKMWAISSRHGAMNTAAPGLGVEGRRSAKGDQKATRSVRPEHGLVTVDPAARGCGIPHSAFLADFRLSGRAEEREMRLGSMPRLYRRGCRRHNATARPTRAGPHPWLSPSDVTGAPSGPVPEMLQSTISRARSPAVYVCRTLTSIGSPSARNSAVAEASAAPVRGVPGRGTKTASGA